MIRSIFLPSVLVVAACACISRRAAPAQPGALAQLPPQVRAAWQTQRDRLVRIIRGKKFEQADFITAEEFFERVTGLPAHDNLSFIGRLPNKNLESDLSAWDGWLDAHAACLRLNPGSGTVECAEDGMSRAEATRSPSSSQ